MLYILLRTGGSTVTTMIRPLLLDTDQTVDTQLIEAPTITTAGTAVPLVNANRVSSATPLSLLYTGTTGVTGGTTILNKVYGSGTSTRLGTFHRIDEQEFVLKPNTDYVFKLTNVSATSVVWANWLLNVIEIVG
ncbi:hypothetical protein [Clostridium felsineum]|uniref:hypothetical protein n=1 Tax=Clostridium felsineum TaxID=36839 RepID=UPI002033B54B|nr:hypothetical protein [Clostridium felsineum]